MPAVRPALDLNPEFLRALHLMEHGAGSVLVTGRAGTGKSTLLRYFRDRTRLRVAVVAPTGVAALNVDGETIHSFFRFRPDVTEEKIKRVREGDRDLYARLDALVIDEVSMVRADLLDCVDAHLKLNGPRKGAPFGGVRLFLIGDLYQLPPVVTKDDRQAFRTTYASPFFFNARSYAALAPEIVELERVYRQHDERFIAVLNAIRNNTVTDHDLAGLNARVRPDFEPRPDELVVCLTPTNRAADEINARRLAALPGASHGFPGRTSGSLERRDLPAPPDLAVKSGAQVMMLNNDADGRWVNGSLGLVHRIVPSRDGPHLLEVELTDGRCVEVTPHTWDLHRYVWNRKARRLDTEPVGSYVQYPLRLAWAVTIHKAQGKTFDRVIVDLGARAFAPGQVYVALSRCTTLHGLVLHRPLRKSDVFVDRRIVRFLTAKAWGAAEAVLPFDRRLEIIREAIGKKQALAMTYLKASDVKSRRVVTPESVGEMTYRAKSFTAMRAHCHLRGELRTFRVDRILGLEPAPSPRPPHS
ncbi:MAG: AAA family ATPase [Candidatus Coatesbacteria bacterium]